MKKTIWWATYNLLPTYLIIVDEGFFILLAGWVISKLTDSSLLTGILLSLPSIPYFFSYFTGTVIDLSRKKKLILLMLSLIVFMILLLSQIALLADNLFFMILLFYLSAIVFGFTANITDTIFSIWTKQNVDEKEYKKIISIGRIILRGLGFLANALVGIILTFIFRFSIIPTLVILAMAIFLSLPVNIKDRFNEGEKGITFKESLIDGFNYVRKNKVLTQISILTLENLFFGILELLMIFYVQDFLHLGPIYYSILIITAQVGLLVGSIFALRINKGKLGFYQFTLIAIMSICIASYDLIHYVFIAIIPTFLISFLSGITSTLGSVTQLRYINKEYWGRASGFIQVISKGIFALSGPVGGILIEILGIGGTYLLIGSIIFMFNFVRLKFKEYYNIEIK
ncbi:MFS transporter [Acidianus brierleyi]|uniref:MFS transporter n=1 Tax=Acidianus brierleyi TaxID=41673 RepID=A0A2U9III1_9CREN|nr:MFS transporter [Acidianus brierleyi]AWR95754.1 MFS transporter [Acidianus brierleyi]